MRKLHIVGWLLWLLGAGGTLALGTVTNPPTAVDWGPFYWRGTDASGDLRLKVIGPLYEKAKSGDGKTLMAVRPFYSHAEDPARERTAGDWLWPIGATKTFRQEFSWRVLLAYYTDFDRTNALSRYHFWGLPVYFQGRDAQTNNYYGLFPIAGDIKDFLWKDRISFVLWPLYVHAEIKDVVSDTWLWPIISETHGGDIRRYRVFPFYGYSLDQSQFEKKFVLWPIWNWARYTRPGHRGTAYIVFPLWGRVNLESQQSWIVLPPLFRYSKGRDLTMLNCPWPLFQYATGHYEKLYIWPLWGKRQDGELRKMFWLWPLIWRVEAKRGAHATKRWSVIPFYYNEHRIDEGPGRDPGQTLEVRRVKLWPLFYWQREGAAKRLRMLDLWPLPNPAPVERSWAPWWTVFQHTAVGDAAETELLWGLYRQGQGADQSRHLSIFPLWEQDSAGKGASAFCEWNVLKGLIGYRRESTNQQFRFLYFFRLGAQETKP